MTVGQINLWRHHVHLALNEAIKAKRLLSWRWHNEA